MKNLANYFIFSLFSFVAVGCGSTAIMKTHPYIAHSINNDTVKVYFIRTDSGFDGVGGNAYTLSMGGYDLLTIAKGEYTLVNLNAYSGDITVESSTVVYRGSNTWIKVKESGQFKFISPNTYYVTFKKQFNDSINGVSVIPYSVTESIAKRLVPELKPIGKAKEQPL